MECIILAGGQGTRLQSVVQEVPKCLAPINGKPFLDYLFNYLESQFVDHVVLSLGYKYEMVLDYLKGRAFTFKVSWVIEKEPLGTGGAIQLALGKTKSKHVFVLNGDTYFPIDLRKMAGMHTPDTTLTIATTTLTNIDRYGLVHTDANKRIISFEEKKAVAKGNINGGIYIINTALAALDQYGKAFSFEQDYMQQVVHNHIFKNFESDANFIDIGIPEDYERAQHIL